MRDLEKLHRIRGGARIRRGLLRLPGVLPRRPRAYWYRGVPNFGDQVSPMVLEWVSGQRPVWVPAGFDGKILATGSILGALAKGDVVWGSGLIRDEECVPPPDVTFLAVRGPLTRSRIAADIPEVYGDPASLLPIFHGPPVQKRHDVGIVPHYVDLPRLGESDQGLFVIDVRNPWMDVVRDIRSCDVILSSSLHGLIVAEAYGIPAGWIRVTDRILGGSFKFNDYYLSTGRDEMVPSEWANGMSAALRRVSPPPDVDPKPLLDAASALIS